MIDRRRLSERAERYLGGLRRRPAVDSEKVLRALERAGCEPFRPWLDFHARYAGFEEPLGREVAIWGLAHPSTSAWVRAEEVSVDRESDGVWSIACADVHGSFDYRLYEDAHFTSFGAGGPCETFDVKVEQNAVFVEARSDGRRWTYDFEAGGFDPQRREAFRVALGAQLVVEASDRFARVWRAPDAIWLEGQEGSSVFQLWTPEDARERIAALRRSG